jgi:hypothetical protein
MPSNCIRPKSSALVQHSTTLPSATRSGVFFPPLGNLLSISSTLEIQHRKIGLSGGSSFPAAYLFQAGLLAPLLPPR